MLAGLLCQLRAYAKVTYISDHHEELGAGVGDLLRVEGFKLWDNENVS